MKIEFTRRQALALAVAAGLVGGAHVALAQTTLLNVSYDPTRELYQEFNAAFIKHWKEKTGEDVTIQQSHGGSGKQARAVIDGLDADVVTLALARDIDAIADKGKLLPADWQKRLPLASTPYTSTIVLLVRKGNPKGIKDWDDLGQGRRRGRSRRTRRRRAARAGTTSLPGTMPTRSTAAPSKAKEFVTKLYKNVAVLDSGARGSTTTFVERGVGDVFISWENEAAACHQGAGSRQVRDRRSIDLSILAQPPVSVVDKNVDKKGTRKVAEAYLEYLYSPEGQEIAGKNFYRPTDEKVAAKYADQFPKIKLFTIDEVFGGWKKAYEDALQGRRDLRPNLRSRRQR